MISLTGDQILVGHLPTLPDRFLRPWGAVRAALAEAGLVAKDYASHSFRIGVATTAAKTH